MGTRGSFYLYLMINGKKILLYSYYSHWDGYLNVGKVVDFYKTLMGNNLTVEQVVCSLSARFGHADMNYFAGDAECIAHAELTCDLSSNLSLSDLGDLNSGFEYVKPGKASYGRMYTGQIGGCYVIMDRKNNVFYPTIAGTKVTLGMPYYDEETGTIEMNSKESDTVTIDGAVYQITEEEDSEEEELV